MRESIKAHYSPFQDELIAGKITEAVARLDGMEKSQAIAIILACWLRDDSVSAGDDFAGLADYLGVFDEYGDDE